MYSKLNGRITEMFGSQSAFAKHIGKSNTFVSARIKGKLGFKRNDVIDWCNALNISLEEIGIYFFAP